MASHSLLWKSAFAACAALSLEAGWLKAQDLSTLGEDDQPALQSALTPIEADDDGVADTADIDAPDDDAANTTAQRPTPAISHEYSEHGYNEIEAATTPDRTAAEPNERQVAPEQAEAADENAGEVELVQERYPNRAIKIEREVTQDSHGNYINHGSWRMWDQNGNAIAEGQYRNGERHGTWNRWYRTSEAQLLSAAPFNQFTGPFVSQATFDNGKLNGKWTITDSKQRKACEWEFADGQRNGKAIWYFSNGKKMREINYHEGDIDGEYLEWNLDGKHTVKESYQMGRKLGLKVENHTAAQKKSEAMYLFAKEVVQTPDDWWNAKLAVYAKQGKDEKHGDWKSWYSSGQKQLEGSYSHDAPEGQFVWWYKNGQKALEGKYEGGKQNGRWVWWHENGQKSIRGQYAKGNPTGRWTWWNQDGKVAQAADLSHAEGDVVEMPELKHDEATFPQPAPVRPRGRVVR